jgi:hypothetical protein
MADLRHSGPSAGGEGNNRTDYRGARPPNSRYCAPCDVVDAPAQRVHWRTGIAGPNRVRPAHGPPSVTAPDAVRGVDDQFELPPLLVRAQTIAPRDRRKPALRAEREMLERHVARRVVDAPAQEV